MSVHGVVVPCCRKQARAPEPDECGEDQAVRRAPGIGTTVTCARHGSGRGGPAVLLARSFGCHLTCVEQSDEFVDAARKGVAEAGVESLIELVTADAKDFHVDVGHYDAALCLGASFIWGGLAETVAALSLGVRAGGFVGVGEPYWRVWPLPDDFEPEESYDFVTLAETVGRFETAGIELVNLIAS